VSRAAATRRIVTASRPSTFQYRQGCLVFMTANPLLACLCGRSRVRSMTNRGWYRWRNVGERHGGPRSTDTNVVRHVRCSCDISYDLSLLRGDGIVTPNHKVLSPRTGDRRPTSGARCSARPPSRDAGLDVVSLSDHPYFAERVDAYAALGFVWAQPATSPER